MSNWENRPLRYSQEHYGAMDAWILVDLVPRCLKSFKSKKMANESVEKCMQCVEPKSEDDPPLDPDEKEKSIGSKSKKQENKNRY